MTSGVGDGWEPTTILRSPYAPAQASQVARPAGSGTPRSPVISSSSGTPPGPIKIASTAGAQPLLDPRGQPRQPVDRLDHLSGRCGRRVPLPPQDALDGAAVPAAVGGARPLPRMRPRERQPGPQGRSG